MLFKKKSILYNSYSEYFCLKFATLMVKEILKQGRIKLLPQSDKAHLCDATVMH